MTVNKKWKSPVVLMRSSAILYIGLMVGHMSAYPWTSTRLSKDMMLVNLMNGTSFEFMGERSTYWNLYFGWGLLVAFLLFTLAIILWVSSNLVDISPGSAGIISGTVSITSLIGAYLSLHFFFMPPFVFFSVICAVLATAAVKLLRSPSSSALR